MKTGRKTPRTVGRYAIAESRWLEEGPKWAVGAKTEEKREEKQ